MNLRYIFTALIVSPCLLSAQKNCSLYPSGSPEQKACELYVMGCQEPQGSAVSQQLFDSAIKVCPTFALAWHEKSVPFLKRGDFANFRKYMDVAVKLDTLQFIGYRAWCLFKMLRDYETAEKDLAVLYQMTGGKPGRSGDDSYDLRMVLAICYRETGKTQKALELMDQYIAESETINIHDVWDYLHRGALKLRMKDYAGALSDLREQQGIYPELADTYYYQALVKIETGKFTEARELLERSRYQYLQGYHRDDHYVEEPDQVHLDDIDSALRSINQKK